jgi:hypothetical protein
MMACVGDKAQGIAWGTIQHEAFHQYAAMRLGHLPIWLNEGLAEYFSHALFTGDGFVSGIMPQWRLLRVRKHLADREFVSMQEMLRFTPQQWNQRIELTNYDQAWAYVQFLAHNNGGADQRALVKYIRDVSRGQESLAAFGADVQDPQQAERRFAQWIQELPDNPTLGLYGQAAVATVTSFVARAAAQRQTIGCLEELTTLSQHRQLLCSEQDWLPPQLLEQVLAVAGDLGEWTFTPAAGKAAPMVALKMHDGTTIRGMFVLNRGRVGRVWVEAQPPMPAPPTQKPGPG